MTSFRLLRPLDAWGRKKPHEAARAIGGKGARLAWLARHGFPVPRGFVIEAGPFLDRVREDLPPGHSPHSLLRLKSARVMAERAAHARARVLALPLPAELAADLAALWAELAPEAPWGLAVRSSATSEDDDLVSMAGLASTVLAVRGADGLARAVREVWASTFAPRSLAYLAAHGVRDVAMAVVIQPMIVADAAGVALSTPPAGLDRATTRPGEMLVNAAWGLGAPVVAGAAAPDVLRVERATGRLVDQTIAAKARALAVGPEGLVERDVPPELVRRPALDGARLADLADVVRRLEALDGAAPWDVEFAVSAGKTWVVQARRLAGLGFPDGGAADTVWSRANVGEALPAPATPLTWSIATSFADGGLRHAFASLGCSVPRGTTLVAGVHGRFYLNLSALTRIAAQVPGLDPRTLVELGGGEGVEVLEQQVAGVSRRAFWARLPITAARLLTEQLRLQGEVDRFEGDAERARRRIGGLDLAILPDDSLVTTLRDLRRLLDETGALMLACASASLAGHLALKTVVARSSPVGAERIVQTLSAGVGDLESAQPGVALAHVAAIARREPEARRVLEAGEASRVVDLPDGPTRRALAQFLANWGDRAEREAELEQPRWSEDPAPVFAMLLATLRGPSLDPEVALARARAASDRELALLDRRLSLVERALVRAILARSQRLAQLRERMRAWVTRVLGMMRSVVLDADRRLLRLDPSIGEGGAFFCTFDELLAALAIGRHDLGELVAARRAEHARDLARPDPPPTFVGRPPPVALPPSGGAVLRGLAASGGVVEGPVRLVGPGGASPAALLPGEILVARTTDVGLTPLFLVAAGVVTELGGPLSHAALVAREYGVPAVVNVGGATTALHDGDRIRVDGDRGVVERLA